MYESTRRARERIIATEILKLERRQALLRSQRRVGGSTASHTTDALGALPATALKGQP
jgi:hypothetical protein